VKKKVGQVSNLSITMQQDRSISHGRRQIGNPSYNGRQVGNLSHRRAFTLLEVMLSLAILVGALAALSELGRTGGRCAKISRDMTRAEMLCEGVMNQVTSGLISPESVQRQSVVDPVKGNSLATDDDIAPWVYSIDLQTIDQDGLIAVTVTVAQDLPAEQHPIGYSLIRWIPDPDIETSDTSSTSTGTGQ
jgi:prepilin-type N-terminal cleavage/methylation domain-containing protein